MPIKPKGNMAALDRRIDEMAQAQRDAIIEAVEQIGEQCVNAARSLPSLSRDNPAAEKPHQPHYIDDTGNLRSSIGYNITVDGKLYKESFSGGGEGATKGKSLARRIAAEHPRGIVLIVVAGMEYATYVSAKGYDVLDTAYLTADKLLRRLMNKLKHR